jgi:hypothetical protein
MTNGNVTAKLEHNSFVATAADIEALTKEQLVATATSVRSKVTYLRALIATTQDKLGLAPRVRQGKGAPVKLKPEEIVVQLAALEEVHANFYTAVLKAIDDTPLTEDEKPKSGRTSAAAIKARRATFARTAMSTVRTWIKAGRSLAGIAPSRITKGALVIQHGQKKKRLSSPKRLLTRAEKQSKDLIATLLELSETDKESAVKEYQALVGVLSDQLAKLSVGATRDAAQAIAEHRPLRIKGTVFVPTATSVLRQQARPS